MAVVHSSVSAAELNRIRQLAKDAGEMRWREGFEPCSYCGVIANSIDHVPPISARERIVDLGLQSRYPFFEVPACRECNSTLGARGLWLLSERRAYIKKRLHQRYASILRIPDWSDNELAQMSKNMQGYVTNGLIVRDFIRQRLAFNKAAVKE